MKKRYLLTYNFLLFLGWGVFFMYQLVHGLQLDSFSLLLLNICQLAALLEIGHAALKWVKSPIFTTAIQVLSRVFVLYWINVIPTDQEITIAGVSGVHLITIAWGLTEIVRYSYYFFILQINEVKWLTYLRYTLFIVLYPMGVLGEWLILLSEMKINGFQLTGLNILLGIILLSYLIFFPKLYFYMFRQRRKKL